MTRRKEQAWEPTGFGWKVYEERVRQELTQQQLAERVGVALSTISFVETCAWEPSLPFALAIAKALGKPIQKLLPKEGETIPERPKRRRGRPRKEKSDE